jgi:hypothetical protein
MRLPVIYIYTYGRTPPTHAWAHPGVIRSTMATMIQNADLRTRESPAGCLGVLEGSGYSEYCPGTVLVGARRAS